MRYGLTRDVRHGPGLTILLRRCAWYAGLAGVVALWPAGGAVGTIVSLRGLPDLIVVQILYAVQQRIGRNVRLKATDFRQVCDEARAQQVASLDELAMRPNTKLIALVRSMTDDVRRGLSTPELEQFNDVWDMEFFGLGKGRRMDFTGLHQEWLRRAAKVWVVEAIPRRYGKNVPNALMSMVTCLNRLSDSLRINRADHGDDPALLSRADINAFLQRLTWNTPVRSAPFAGSRSAAGAPASCVRFASSA